MALQTHYEVHVQQGGRWSIHAQFGANQEDLAIEEAKQLDSQGNIGAVKVIREVYNANKGTHRDYVVYKTAGVTASEGETDTTGRVARHEPDNYGGGDENYEEDFDLSYLMSEDKSKSTLTEFLVKVLLIVLFSLGFALVAVVVAVEFLGGTTLFGYRISGHRESDMVFIVFVGAFLISAGFMSAITFRKTRIRSRARRPRRPRRSRAAPQTSASATRKKRKKRKKHRRGDELDQAMAGSEDFVLAEQETNETNDRLRKEIAGDKAAGPDAGGGVAGTLSPHAEKQKAYMMDFLSASLKRVGGDTKKMDNFNKFGVNLFLAGACEALADKHNLSEKAQIKVLADSVRDMGFKQSHAATFAKKYEEYLLQDPRYMQMYQAGRNAMNTHFGDPGNSAQHMATSLSEWNQPKKQTGEAGPVTVLFTDMAGSTAMTQALGDAAAQEAVRVHNRIVRSALTGNQGREVKHTGDGIMASFSRVADSIDAAIEMQRQAAAHNQQNPNLPLHLKIGINAGEPIVEDNDLFGTVVQLSARIVDKAQAGEILVSEIVKGICSGKTYKFSSKGGYEMKGFDGAMHLYGVDWRGDAATAAE